MKHYSITKEGAWHGRIDDRCDFESFRWHQWVQPLNLEETTEPYKGRFAVGFLGFQCDCGIERNKGRVGAAKGPDAIRKEMSPLPCQFGEDIALFDCGNITFETSLESAQEALGEAVHKMLSLNLFPIILGGGHEVAFGHYQGLDQFLNDKSAKDLGIINFDAHFDMRPYAQGASSGTMFRQIADHCKNKNQPFHYFVLGIQKHSNTDRLFHDAKDFGASYILAREVVNGDLEDIKEQLDEFIKDRDRLYVTICSDVFSTSYAPGVSAPQPLGLDPEKVILLLKHIMASKKMMSFDIAEVSPRFDQDNTTANLAAVLIFTVVTYLAKEIFIETFPPRI